MGVDLGALMKGREVELGELAHGRVAIDAFNALYQFLSIIRQRDGTPLLDSAGRITSHLSGLLYRTSNMMEVGIMPFYVFDGEPPALKRGTLERREHIRESAKRSWEEARERGEDGFVYAQASSRVDEQILDDAKRLLSLMGVPFVVAPSEGEAQAAHMTRKGDADYAGSQDYDTLVFGAPKVVRNLAITGRRKLPRRRVYVDVKPEVIELDAELERLGITREQLVDIAILVGTDYNPGIKGIGPKKAYGLVKKGKDIFSILDELGEHIEHAEEIRQFFLEPEVTDDYELVWSKPDSDGVIQFLCEERDFSQERVERALHKLEAALESQKQRSLDAWF
ncbi:MAG: flap endonuclease [Methanosarcinales archaeon]|uniref:flap endonuclease-1 n=1 Tax=Methermicoccus shengliensis TaxID=660064 RepID=UPI0005B2DF83|nr:flap endonuclease-1 [Methermicoccus shengliensis]KUK03918.1 MAG: Flap endonuclease 1 [Euryarchaeota archaeon 55_53]MDI3488719.1 flap endonuclease [Methanosarcinales archaeon]MDN5295639.1 flap endonuclease [Methanosarcinales archaeon]